MKYKATLYGFLACLSGAILILMILVFALVVIEDIRAGVLHGEPETGWGILFSIFICLPIAAVAFAALMFFLYKLKNQGNRPQWIIWAGSSALAVLIAIGFTIHDNSTKLKVSSKDSQATQNLTDTKDLIENWYYSHNRSLPTEAEVEYPSIRSMNYKIISNDTFQLCENFETNTITDDYINYPNSGNSKITKQIVDDYPLNAADTIIGFKVHRAGAQCYKVTLVRVQS